MIGLNISTTDKPVIVVDYEKRPDHDGFFKTIFTYKNGRYEVGQKLRASLFSEQNNVDMNCEVMIA